MALFLGPRSFGRKTAQKSLHGGLGIQIMWKAALPLCAMFLNPVGMMTPFSACMHARKHACVVHETKIVNKAIVARNDMISQASKVCDSSGIPSHTESRKAW